MTIENTERIKELETKSIFQEDAIERLSKEVRLQQIEIIKLKDNIDQLMNTLKEPESISKNDEKPPHY
ncbi:SlyX family protein [Gammaproteobacteria bacterium]|nr:SlyX family protein [Gammaproteobacteria bacterium]